MSGEPAQRLSPDQVRVLKFAAHRQLARWAKQRELPRAGTNSAPRSCGRCGLWNTRR